MITMGPFLENFKKGLPLGQALDSFISHNPQHQLALILKKIHNANADTQYFDDAIAAVNRIDYKEYAVEEQLILLLFLSHLYCVMGRLSNANSVFSIAKRLVSPNLPIEWQVIPLDIEAGIQFKEGNYNKQIEILEKCMQILTVKSEKYKVYLWAYLIQISTMVDNEKFENKLNLLKDFLKNTPSPSMVELVLLNKNVEDGNFQTINSHVNKIREDKSFVFFNNDILMREKIYEIFIKNNYDCLDDQNFNDWPLLSLACLLKNDPQKSLFWAHKYAELALDYKLKPIFIYYFLIRAELANGNTNAAEYSLDNRKKFGNTCVFDDFFWFRIHHLKGETELAQYYFNIFSTNVTKQKLDKRFDLELKLSPEITFAVIRNYARNLDKPTSLNRALNKPNDSTNTENTLNFIIGKSPQIKQVKDLIKKFSTVDTSVLIFGETGTGKELVAKALWQIGLYNKKPFITINCGAISEHLLQSELFGHKKGSFTGAYQDHKGIFEEAGDGIVFMDEIGEINHNMQVNLLRILEAREYRPVGSNSTKKISCKIIAATNRNLADLVKAGSFREDLQFRLERLVIEVPPLRNRPDDIPVLIEHFLNTQNQNLANIYFDKQALSFLCSLPWPGNIRELRNEMERIRLFFSDKKILTIAELSDKYKQLPINPTPIKIEIAQNSSPLNLKSKFRKLDELKQIFKSHQNLSRSDVAVLLKVSNNTAANYLNILEAEKFIKKNIPTQTKSNIYQII